MIDSRAKGKRAELSLAKTLRDEYGYDCRRGQQYCGANGDADVVGLPGIHIECKFVEDLDLEAAMVQSEGDARDGEYPVVMHRKKWQKWQVTIRIHDLFGMQGFEYDKGKGKTTITLDDFMSFYEHSNIKVKGNEK